MTKHARVFLKSRGLIRADLILCEIPNCNRIACDIHHIKCKGMGGRAGADVPENLIALCREHHDQAHKNDGVLTERAVLDIVAAIIARKANDQTGGF